MIDRDKITDEVAVARRGAALATRGVNREEDTM